MSRKTFVLDTSTIIHDPHCFAKFQEHDITVPIPAIEELDQLKKIESSVGYAAREAVRQLVSLIDTNDMSKGARLPGGGVLKVVMSNGHVFDDDTPDNRIINVAKFLNMSSNIEKPVVLISKDASMRLKCGSLGIPAQDYRHDKSNIFRQYGRVLTSRDNVNGIKSLRYFSDGVALYRLKGSRVPESLQKGLSPYGLSPLNIEQECAIDAIFNPAISVVALAGRAGSGKSLLSIACGLHFVEKGRYEQIVVTRPLVPVGSKDIGYLPGDMGDKMAPWIKPVVDCLDFLVKTPQPQEARKQAKDRVGYKSSGYLIDRGIVQIEPIMYLRGRNLTRKFYIIEEAQNTTPLEMKTILTRAAAGTKVVMTGDLDQIDCNFLDSESNGFAYFISRFINEEDFCYLNLVKTCRSRLAERAAQLL